LDGDPADVERMGLKQHMSTRYANNAEETVIISAMGGKTRSGGNG
jgi:hypothetical protein